MRETKLAKITSEAKLAKIVTIKQLDANFTTIERNTFFENRKSKISSLNTTLSNSVKEQYRSSLSMSYAAKYARIWLEKVRQRKAERAMLAEGQSASF